MHTTAIIFTALPVEQKAVASFLSNVVELEHPNGTIYDVGDFFSGNVTLRVAVAEIGKGNPGAAMEAERAIAFFAPEYAFFVGVAGGLKDVSVGDVVAADKVYGYEFGKDAQHFKPRPEFGAAHYELLQKARSVARKGKWRTRIDRQEGFSTVPDAYVGPIAAGEKVVAARDAQAAVLLRSNFSDALAVEMEGYGFLRAVYANPVKGLVVRGVSDLLEGKTEADAAGSQQIASLHAAAFVFEILAGLDGADESPQTGLRQADMGTGNGRSPDLHDQLIVNELDSRFRDAEAVLRHEFAEYSRFFSIICNFRLLPPAEHVFASLWKHVAESHLVEAIQVSGYPGVGKSSFLQLFYWYVYFERLEGRTATVPIYVNLHGYNTKSSVISSSLSKIRDFCRAHIETPYLFILDGVDQYASHRDYVVSEVTAITEEVQHKKIVAQRIGADEILSELEQRGDLLFFDRVAINSPQFQPYIEAFVQLQSTPTADRVPIEKYIVDSVRQCRLQEVDLFVLGLIFGRYMRPGANAIYSLIDLLDQHVRSQFQNHGVARGSVEGEIHKAAAVAFKLHVESRVTDEKSDSPLLYSIVQSHTRIADFLVARYIVLQLTSPLHGRSGKKTLDALRYVHPYRINSLCKELLNRTVPTQQTALATIRGILRNRSFDPYQKADACYLAGRFTDRLTQSQAREELQRFLSGIDVHRTSFANEDEERRHLLLVRSCYISLAYLGDRRELNRYVDHLLTDFKWDNFNRGFHLEYYGDQPYAASVGLLSSDAALKPFPLTFDQLSERLLRKDDNPLLELELQTLCSLSQHRHAAGRLEDSKRLALIDLLSDVLQSRRIGHAGLRRFVSVVLQHLRDPGFRIGRIGLDLLNVKRVKRQGWVIRGIADCESVADHTIGAMVLAALYLPDEPLDDDSSYDKQQILMMLFVHDLIESITGDILPWDKHEEVIEREKVLYSAFRVLGTYHGIARLDWVDNMWTEFEAGDSTNARIARDVDKLENLFQLSIYIGQGIEMEGSEEFERKLIEQIETPYGEHLLSVWSDCFRPTIARQPMPQ